ncbi:MAG: hypothetical protein GXX96_05830 [Planctomycetaceae bacterium]|jgi:hypothetical protein|nr:hypothetical protein [Planctomycetaceae bacterium]
MGVTSPRRACSIEPVIGEYSITGQFWLLESRSPKAVCSERWRYIRYADGGEEIYDQANDPNEWSNLAANPELADVKAELATWLPKTDAPAVRDTAKRYED